MAKSGSKSYSITSWDDLVFNWSISSQNIENNTSTIAWNVKLVSGSSGRIDSSVDKYLVVNVGSSASYTNYVSVAIANNQTKTLRSGTTTIKHDADGTKTFNFSVQLNLNITFSGESIGTVLLKGSDTLDTIPQCSTMSVTSGNLGESQTITVTRHSSSFMHTIRYKCGSVDELICTNSSNTSISFTPPLSLATTNTTGQSVDVTFTINTVNGNTTIGSKKVTVTYKMRAADFAPTVSISVSDPNGHKQTYGSYVKGLSKFGVTVTATPKQGASISTYSSRANDAAYTSASFTTELLKTSGTLAIAASVKDSRGFTGTATTSVSVLDYTPPSISKLTVHRCNSDGTENNQGEYIRATFSVAVAALSNKNTATYKLRYKKSSESSYQEVALTALNNRYTAADQKYTFIAATDSSYDVELEVKDNHSTTKRATSASTAFTLIHFRSDGTGIGFGKISENANAFDFGLPITMSGGTKPPLLVAQTDLNEVRTPNTYIGENVSTYSYLNCPVTSGTFTLLVESCGDAEQVKQTYTTCSKYKPEKYSRFYYQNAWSGWSWASTDEVVLYDNASGTDGTITFKYADENISVSHFRYLEIYFMDNNGKHGGYTKVYSPNGKSVCLHIQEPSAVIYSRQTYYTISGSSMTPDVTNASFIKFSGTSFSITSGRNCIKVVRVVGRA